MASSADIIMGYKPPRFVSPLEQQTRRGNLQNLLQGNELNDLKLGEARSGMERANTLRAFLQSNPDATPEQVMQGTGDYESAMKLGKYRSDQATAATSNESNQFKTRQEQMQHYTNGLKAVYDSPNPKQTAVNFINESVRFGTMKQDMAQQLMGQLQNATDEQVKQTSLQMFQQALDADKQLPKTGMQDAGGQIVPTSTDVITGEVTQPTGAINKTASPESIMTDARTRSEGAANRGVTIAGQRITRQGQIEADARAKEKNANDASAGGYSTKPLPTTALKLQNETLDKLSIANNNNVRLNAIQKKIEGGQLELGLVSNIEGNLRNKAGLSTESSRNLSTFKSSIEKLRNDSLRLNTGVQTDGDAQRAWNELFENINDKDLVLQRLKEIQEINVRGAELQKLQVENIRSNYNAPPVDFGRYEAKPDSDPSTPKFDADKEARYQAWKKSQGK